MDKGAEGTVTEPYRTRITALFARGGTTAVLLRRGPRLHHHLITWDLKRDVFVRGQWMKGTVHLYDLNDAGDKLIYWARQFHASAPRHEAVPSRAGTYEPLNAATPLKPRGRRKIPRYMAQASEADPRRPKIRRFEGVWTAISTPPYFSALAVWPCYGHWTGGGVFLDDRTVALWESDDGMTPQENVPLPPTMTVEQVFALEQAGRTVTRRAYAPTDTASDPHREAHVPIVDARYASGARWVEWVNASTTPDLLFAVDGQVFRLAGWQRFGPESYLHAATRLLDLRPMAFALKEAPAAALRW
ncbi:MAG: hypothetical protein AAGD34_01065 [Pseudomonadota bacterium]